MSQNWFSSDFHGFHKNICRGTSEWDKGPITEPVSGIHGIQTTRDFKTIPEMNLAIWKGINDNVGEDDTLYFLGDWTFGGIESVWKFRREIVCKNIHFILGNHDKVIEQNGYLPNVHTAWSDKAGGVVLMDGPCPAVGGHDKLTIAPAMAKELFSSVNYYKHISIGKQEIIMSHYAFRVWNRSHHGSIHLYGHSHDSLDRDGTEWGKSMDVGIDSAYRRFGVYRPFSEAEIMDIMAKRPVNIVDHHNKNTN